MSETHDPLKEVIDIWLGIHRANKEAERAFGVSLIQLQILKAIHAAPEISPKDLARAIGFHASSLTPLLQRLTFRQLIFMDTDPKDLRCKTVVLTREGLRLIEEAEAGARSVAQRVLTEVVRQRR